MVKYLIIFVFAGHGIMKDGRHAMLYNEFDLKTRYYKMFRAEEKIRTWAELYPNSYTIGIFATSRILYNEHSMTNCIPLFDMRNYSELRNNFGGFKQQCANIAEQVAKFKQFYMTDEERNQITLQTAGEEEKQTRVE